MSENDIAIPKVHEQHSSVRVVWFGSASTVTRNDLAGNQTSVVEATDEYIELSGFTKSDGGQELATNGESDVASLSWNKDTESPCGVCNLLLFPRQPYHTKIEPDDVLVVYAKGDKRSRERLITVLSVDSVHEQRSVANGATTTRISVTARDLGKVMQETPTVYDAAFGKLVGTEFYSRFIAAFAVGTAQGGPSVVVQAILATFFSVQQNFVTRAIGAPQINAPLPNQTNQQAADLALQSIPDDVLTKARFTLRPWRFVGNPTKTLFQFIDTKRFVQKPMVGSMAVKASLLHNAGNLWALCEMYANRIVNEFFIDVRDLVDGYDDASNRAAHFATRFLRRYGGFPQEQVDQLDRLSTSFQEASAAQEVSARARAIQDVGFAVENPARAVDFEDFDFATGYRPDDADGEPVVALVHRQLPYDTQTFYSLPTSIVYETETKSNTLVRSSHDVKNMFRIRFPDFVSDLKQDIQFGVTIDRKSIERHGIRKYEGESIYTGVSPYELSYIPTWEFYQSLVTTWFAYGERLWSGNISMRFRPDIRVGTRLTYVTTRPNGTKRVVDLYVQRVSHSWSPRPGTAQTAVDVIRGIERDDLSVEPMKESHLFWTDRGGQLNPDPYEVVQSEDLLVRTKRKAPAL